MDVVNGIDLSRCGVLPAKSQRSEPPYHFVEHEPSFLPQARWTYIPRPHDVIAIIAASFRRFPASGDDERGVNTRGLFRVGEGVEGRLRRRIDRGQTLLRATGLVVPP
jgi:hypothetical protein